VTGELVTLGDAHGACLAVETVLEAQRARAPARVAGVGLEQRDRVPAALQLERRAQPGEPGAQDHHVQAPGGLGDGAQIVEDGGAHRHARRETEAADEVTA
jgi:hypothetical protein